MRLSTKYRSISRSKARSEAEARRAATPDRDELGLGDDAFDEPGESGSPRAGGTVNRTATAWSAVRARRSVSSSFSSFLTSPFRRSSAKPGPDPWSRKQRLMRAHSVKTADGRVVEVFFGTESVSLDGAVIKYSDIVFWSHSTACFKLTFVTTSERVEVALFPTEGGPSPHEINEMMGMRVAQLVADQTGCSEDEARDLATREATESELKLVSTAIESTLRSSSGTPAPAPATTPAPAVVQEAESSPA